MLPYQLLNNDDKGYSLEDRLVLMEQSSIEMGGFVRQIIQKNQTLTRNLNEIHERNEQLQWQLHDLVRIFVLILLLILLFSLSIIIFIVFHNRS